MKKIVWAVVITAAIILPGTYLLIPNIVNIKQEQSINTSQAGLQRMLLTKSNVLKWWPGTQTDSGSLLYNGNTYEFANNNITLIPVLITNNSQNIHSTIFSLAPAKETVQLTWVCKTVTSYNPIKRIQYWLKAKNLNTDLEYLLEKMNDFYSNTENIYGIKIEKKLVEDSILISTAAACKNFPTTEFIYTQIAKLNTYAAINNAQAAGYPMLNIETDDGVNYNVRLALPVNKIIPDKPNDITLKRMLGGGNILVAEVKGGNATTAEALRQINLYARDYQRIPPAIPFFSLITNRMAEADSSKWITKVYCPVM